MSSPPPPSDRAASAQVELDRVENALRTRYWTWVEHDWSSPAPSVEAFLTERLPHIDPASWPQRADFGGIYVNGREATLDQKLPVPCKVEYYEPKFRIEEAHTVFPHFLEEYVIFHDNHVAVVFKPARLSSMPAKEQRHFSLKASLEKLFKTPIHMPSRLDVSVQGLVVVSVHPDAHRGLQRAFELRQVSKTYHLVTASSCAWDRETVDAPLARDPRHPVLRCVSPVEGQSAVTHFEVLERPRIGYEQLTLISARPITGRTHQIRVHAAHLRAPIIGDNFYGGAPSESLHLVSYALSFPHPVTQESLSFVLPAHLTPAWASSAST